MSASGKSASLPPFPAFAAAGLAVLAIVVAAFAVGKYPVSPADLLRSVWARMTGADAQLPQAVEIVIWNIRLPRIMAGIFVGAALAAAGAAYQNMFRNPLVSPDILGVSAGAGFGATLGIFLGWPLEAIQVIAFACGLAAVGAVYGVSALVRRHDPILVLVLAGIAVGTLLNAGVSLFKLLSDPSSQQLSTIVFWLLGSLNGISSRDLASAAPLVLIGLAPMALLRWRVNLLSLPDEEAAALGLEVTRLRLALIVAATLATAAVVSIAGIVGWVGLIIPHAARFLVGPSFSRLLPASLLLGAGFIVAADTLARTLVVIELPLGIVTAIIGAPFFLYLLARNGKEQ
ncbi:iron ABC transporter permease [Diaphorobacter ruginosibacter]|uniref:FecCD family ABC transporter permease n=1 Tax=Diaphorobacter ruginosibacter TaxID=1715720 RepID=UPI0033410212